MSSEGSSSSSSSSKWVEDLQRSVIESKDSAIRSARSLQLQHMNKKNIIPSLEDAFVHYQTYEHAFLDKLKEELRIAKEHPAAAIGISLSAAFLLMRGPRRFLFRNTLGRLQSEEARYVRSEKNVKELNLSVDLMKKESTKLLERAALAEKEMKHGETELRNAGSQDQRLAKQAYQVETQAADLMEGLREIPGREALKLRAEVASMASILKRQRVALNKRIMKISELGIPV